MGVSHDSLFVRFLKRIVPVSVKARILAGMRRQLLGFDDAEPSFSHCGEDRILAYLFKRKRSGFYVDVGAYHPIRSSNTHLFYLQGWRGINIDAHPDSMAAFRALRPRDVNIEIAVAHSEGERPFYRIGSDHHQMAGMSRDFQSRFCDEFDVRVDDVRAVSVRTRPLRSILADHVPPGQRIDFLTIDVEGFEMEVLQSNDWDKFRPAVIMVEQHAEMTPQIFCGDVPKFLAPKGYRLIAKTPNEIVFLDNAQRLTPSAMIDVERR